MNRRTVAALVVNDLRQLARNPRVLVFAIGLPLVLWPLMWFLTSLTTERRQERIESRTYTYAVADEAASIRGAADARMWLERALAVVGDDARADAVGPTDGPAVRFERVEDPDDVAAALDQERLHVHVAWEAGDNEDLPTPRIVLSHRADIDASDSAEGFLRRALERTRTEVREQRLTDAGFAPAPDDLLPLERIETATEEQTSGLLLGRLLTAIIVMMMLAGGSIVATDALAGEKERGTLETLLTTAASRVEIVAAKNLSILAVAFATSVLNIANIVVWMQLDLIAPPAGLQLVIPVGAGLLLLLLYAPAASAPLEQPAARLRPVQDVQGSATALRARDARCDGRSRRFPSCPASSCAARSCCYRSRTSASRPGRS